MRARRAMGAVLAGAVGAGALAAGPAGAAITPTRDAAALARSIAEDPAVIAGAGFETIPPAGRPAAVSTTLLGEFPVGGRDFVILSSGDATLADRPNSGPDDGAGNGGEIVRGARDVTTLRIRLDVPARVNCLSVRFRFYSEEFPEFVGSAFNDAFIAELDSTTWDASGTASPSITAPDNFAADEVGRPITINSIGAASVEAGLASGTTYDAASRRLRASTPITPGAHTLFLTILDQGDRIYDSAVFLDRLTLDRQQPCVRGVAEDLSAGTPPHAVLLPNGRVSVPANRVFPPDRLRLNQVRFVRPGGAARAQLRGEISDSNGFLVRRALVTARSVPAGLIRPARAITAADGTVRLGLRPTARLRRVGALLGDLLRRDAVDVYVCARKPRETETEGISTCRIEQVPMSRLR